MLLTSAAGGALRPVSPAELKDGASYSPIDAATARGLWRRDLAATVAAMENMQFPDGAAAHIAEILGGLLHLGCVTFAQGGGDSGAVRDSSDVAPGKGAEAMAERRSFHQPFQRRQAHQFPPHQALPPAVSRDYVRPIVVAVQQPQHLATD